MPPTTTDIAKASKQGEKDGRGSAIVRSYQDERTWQRADKGYNRSFGDLERYRQQFRAGLRRGLSATGTGATRRLPAMAATAARFRVRTPYGVSERLRRIRAGARRYYGNQATRTGSTATATTPAYPNGLRDGIEKGREDVREAPHRYDPLRHEWYRSGDHDYHERVRLEAAVRRTCTARGSRKATTAAIASSATR